MMEIILVRHGETDWNAAGIFRGRADVDLNDIGMRQAEMLGEYLSGDKIDSVYSSPLKRAVKTAQAVAGRQVLEVNIVQNLIDFDCGEWQGLSRQEVRERYPELYQDWADLPEQVSMPRGESLEDVRKRAWPFIEDVVLKCGEGRVVLVSHRVVNKVLICAMLGLDNSHFWNIRLDNCGITRFSYEGNRLILTRHNDTACLQTVRKAPLDDF
jgi:broad specificity phosphatase PhoE